MLIPLPSRNDVATLALHSAIADNKAAHNLSNAFIDQFESDAGIDTETTCDRSDSEFMSSVVVGTGGSNSGIWDSTATQGLRYAADSRYEFAGDLTVEWWQKHLAHKQVVELVCGEQQTSHLGLLMLGTLVTPAATLF